MASSPHSNIGPSPDLIAEAAREYRAGQQRKSAHPPAGVIADDARLGFLFDCLWEATRHAIAAKVALGAEDRDLAHNCLGALVEDVKTIATTWNRLRADQKREGRADG